jgi:hypothetical protein
MRAGIFALVSFLAAANVALGAAQVGEVVTDDTATLGSCRLALPASCDLAATPASGKAAKNERTVIDLTGNSLAACTESARAAAGACLRNPDQAAGVTLRFRKGPVDTVLPVAEPLRAQDRTTVLKVPIVYGKNFETEAEQFNYRPRFAPGAVDFGAAGQILVRHQAYLQIRARGGEWRSIDFANAAGHAIAQLPDTAAFDWVWDTRSPYTDQRIHVDSRGRLYTLVQGGSTRIKPGAKRLVRGYLLVSTDGGNTWTAAPIPMPDDRGTWRSRIEFNDGNNYREGPPPLLVYDRDEDNVKRSKQLFLWTPRWDGASLVGPGLVKISDDSLLQENHSGAANSLVSTAERIYIVFPGSTGIVGTAGTPAYLAVYNKQEGKLNGVTLIGFGGAAERVDNHNIPGICIGFGQELHVLLTGHQESLGFRTAKPDSDSVAWRPLQVIGQQPVKGNGYTYGSLNCDAVGNVYVTSRWAGDAYHFKLVLLKRDAVGRWGGGPGSRAHQVLLDPGRAFYAAWRQKVSLDADGSLYVSYAYYGNHLSEDEMASLKWRFPFEEWGRVKESVPRDCRGTVQPKCWRHPMPEVTHAVILSKDGGANFRLLD